MSDPTEAHGYRADYVYAGGDGTITVSVRQALDLSDPDLKANFAAKIAKRNPGMTGITVTDIRSVVLP